MFDKNTIDSSCFICLALVPQATHTKNQRVSVSDLSEMRVTIRLVSFKPQIEDITSNTLKTLTMKDNMKGD